MSEGEPRYSDEESALILQRAAELQAQLGGNLSLPELESAAAEAGIDVALVRRAADELATLPALRSPALPPAPTSGGMLGAPLALVHERAVSGELHPSTWEDANIEIRRQLGLKGQLDALGRQFSWSNESGRKIRVSIVPRGKGYVIRVEERLSELGGGLFLGMGLPMTLAGLGFILPICIAVIGVPALIPVALALWATMAFTLARTIFKNIGRNRNAQLHALADGLAEVCSRSTTPRSTT